MGNAKMCEELRDMAAWFDSLSKRDNANFLRSLAARIEAAPVAVMDTRDALGICAPAEDDFPALYALQGKRVRLLVEADQQDGHGLTDEELADCGLLSELDD